MYNSPYLQVGGRLISRDSEEGKELLKWEKPYRFEKYPLMVYRARRRPDGIVSVGEGDDAAFGGKMGAAETWTNGCQMIVRSEQEHQKAKENGWRDTQAEAIEAFEAKERKLGQAAAERAYEDRNMSEAAKAEVEAAESQTVEHLPEVPEKRRRGRPRKNVAA